MAIHTLQYDSIELDNMLQQLDLTSENNLQTHFMETIESLDRGEDIKKLLVYGEYQGNLLFYPQGTPEEIIIQSYTQNLKQRINSLESRVAALEA